MQTDFTENGREMPHVTIALSTTHSCLHVAKEYPGISAREATQKAQTMCTKLKERYVMGVLFISNLNFDKYSTQMDNMGT